MASGKGMVDYICAELRGAGDVTYRKMFGEYGIYLDAKFVGTVCDNTLFLKVTKEAQDLEPQLDLAPAYEGAKPSFRIPTEMLEDPDRLADFANVVRRTQPSRKA